MSYQVLARKWRPRDFDSLVGQDHVVRALTHALDQQRLHHAYLFTGTRGVGKTTLARILAKSLNCETGLTARPCGKCQTCVEIDAGRYVDLLEVDAATNTKVEEMRQLLENAVYSPSRGRFKVYVIDEVHMLSTSAFNAMLKTLEEPPEHVKFILATTDPQKIPVTVLSRCLQFNLKQMTAVAIIDHLARILEQESIVAEQGALTLIAASARGSMRDALSLMDQAIAYSGGSVDEVAVSAMLGTVDEDYLYAVLDNLSTGSAAAVLEVAAKMEALSVSFDWALQDLASLIHRIALVQSAPQAVAEQDVSRMRVLDLAARFDPEELQLFYQIVINGRQELPLAPDSYAGFTMTLLRMFAFRPDGGAIGRVNGTSKASTRVPNPAIARSAIPSIGEWPAMVKSLKLGGIARQLAQQCALVSFKDDQLVLRIPPSGKHLAEKGYQDKLCAAVGEMLDRKIRMIVEVGNTAGASAQDLAVASINDDDLVKGLVEHFDARIVESSIKPVQ